MLEINQGCLVVYFYTFFHPNLYFSKNQKILDLFFLHLEFELSAGLGMGQFLF